MDRTSAFVKTQNVLTIQKLGKLMNEDDRTLYQEQEEITAKAFLETPSENNPIFSAAIKRFSDSYNVDDEKWGQPVADDVQNAVMLAFNQTISEDHLKKLLE